VCGWEWLIHPKINNKCYRWCCFLHAYRLQCWYNYRNRAAVFCFVVRTLVIGLRLYYFINNMQTSILKPPKFRSSSVSLKSKHGWIHSKSRKLIRWITAEILLLKCLSYTYHEEQGCIFSHKNTIFLILWARESYVFLLPEAFDLCPKICRKCDSGRGSATDPAVGAHDAPSRLGSGHPSPYSTPLGASMLAPSAPRLSCSMSYVARIWCHRVYDTKSWRRHW